jgi:hypothetical protein
MIKALKDLEPVEGIASFILNHRGVRLVQVHKVSNALDWGIGIENYASNGLVLELTFNNENPDAQKNISKVKSQNSPWDFISMDIEGGRDGKVFFVFFPDPVNYDELLELIYWIVDQNSSQWLSW